MAVLDFIFLLSLLSIGYGGFIYPYCRIQAAHGDYFVPSLSQFNQTVQLAFPNNTRIYRTEETMQCNWRIGFAERNKEIRITFHKFHLNDSDDCNKESLEIKFPGYNKDKNMKFCDGYPNELQLTSDKVEDRYIDIVLLHYYPKNVRALPDVADFNITIQKNDVRTSKVSELTAGEEPMYIYSPGYPNEYYKYINMTWKITANETMHRIMFEFLWLKLESSSKCEYDFIHITGVKTDFRECGHKSKFLVAANDSSVRMRFESDGYTSFEGFVVKYYTVPYADYEESCQRNGLKLTAIPFIPQLLTVTKTNEKNCLWIIEPDAESIGHVIVFEILSYFTETFQCNQRLYITDTFSSKLAPDYHQTYIPQENVTKVGGTVSNCINKAVQYYRSMSSAITVRLVDSTPAYSEIGNVTFSYYSIPRVEYMTDVIYIGYRPSYIWLLKPKVGLENHEVLFKAENGCIELELTDEKMRRINDNIGNHLEIYDGDSKDSQDLVNGCDEKRNGSVISGTKQFMFIRVKHPKSNQVQVKLLKITSTDKCDVFVRKIVLSEDLPTYILKNPKYPAPLPKNSVCRYEVSTNSISSKLSIHGRSQGSGINTCGKEVEFMEYHAHFFSWCFTNDFTKMTDGNQIRFTLKTDDYSDSIRYYITFQEIERAKVAVTTLTPGQCHGRQIMKPQPGINYRLTSPYYPNKYPPNLDCEWLIIAPGGYEINLIIKEAKLQKCSDSLKLYDDEAWIEFILFDYCTNYPSYAYKEFDSTGGTLLLQFQTDDNYGSTGFDITYGLIETKMADDLLLTLRPKTFNFGSSWENLGNHLQRRFSKPYVYLHYRIRLAVSGVDEDFCKIGYITFTNVIMDAEFYEKLHLCDTGHGYTTLYSSHDDVTMEIDISVNKPFSISVMYNMEKTPTCSPGRPLLLFAKEEPNTFTSPNYPGHYGNNQYCQWKIQASDNYVLYLEVLFSDLGGSSNANYRDYVAIYDGGDRYSRLLGKFTGSTRVIYTSSSDVVFIEFYSDSSDTNTGFKIQYMKILSETSSQSSSKSNSAAVIAGCIGAIIFIMVVGIFSCVCCKRKRANDDRRRQTRSSSVVYNSSNNTVFVLSPVISNNTTIPPPAYSALENLGFTNLPQYSVPATDDLPPPYSDLPSYEDSQQYEIPNSRSASTSSTLNNTTESETSNSGQSPNQQDGASVQNSGSQDQLYDNVPDQMGGIDNPALSVSSSSLV